MQTGTFIGHLYSNTKARIYDPETGKYLNDKAFKDIEDAMNGIGISKVDSLQDFYKEYCFYSTSTI